MRRYIYLFAFAISSLSLVRCGPGICADANRCHISGATDTVDTADMVVSTVAYASKMASTLHRTKGTPQITLEQELALGSGPLPTGYREFTILGRSAPLVVGDNEGLIDGGVSYATRPGAPCGTTQTTIEARIADCAAANPAASHWRGETLGNAGQGDWTLVTYTGAYEVWRDDRTRLLWSDSLPALNWCRAAGVSGGGPFGQVDASGVCNNGANQDQATPESACTEALGLNTPAAYDGRKGGMRLAATGTSPSVVWRLPTIWDYHTAEINGIRLVYVLGYAHNWAAGFSTILHNYGFRYIDSIGGMGIQLRTDSIPVRCVGRPGDAASSAVIPPDDYVDVSPSGMLRDKTATQLTLRQELDLRGAALPTGYRAIPDLTKDDDGSSGNSVTFATRPSVICGTTQTNIADRVQHCATQNPTTSTWNGATQGHAAQGKWKLVTNNGTHEVWRDEMTGLVWSDYLVTDNWCRAAGNSGGGPAGEDDPSDFCDSPVYQDQTTPVSYCTEGLGYDTPPAYDSMKGGMRLTGSATSPSVRWRLPTAWDHQLAELHGIRYVLPNSGLNYWSSSGYSLVRSLALYTSGTVPGAVGGGYNRDSNVDISVRCVGR